MATEDVAAVTTAAGMFALWRASAFADIDGYETWEQRVNDRLGDAIRSGELVPIGIQGDGRIGRRGVGDGGAVLLSGVEAVGDVAATPITLRLPKGRYAVRASLVAWDEEPGARGPDGKPTQDALADFLVRIEPSDGSEVWRTDEATFNPPD